ncbi:MAG: flagellar biosynthesis protein FliQ [Oscillospiraceae bacterium]
MSQDQALTVFKEAFIIILKVGGPILLISIIIGLVISILQAATQVHEQTLTFVPKLLAIGVVLLISGSWMMNVLKDFTTYIFGLMANI